MILGVRLRGMLRVGISVLSLELVVCFDLQGGEGLDHESLWWLWV